MRLMTVFSTEGKKPRELLHFHFQDTCGWKKKKN